jgi:hypothetical protein
MMIRSTALVLGMLLFWGASALAQGRAPEPGAVGTSGSAEPVPISVERIRRELERPRSARDAALRLDYYIEVYGRTAALDAYLASMDFTGPARHGGPSHRDILHMITPQEFRPPVADIGALVRWINQKLEERQKEREARRRNQ